MTQDPRKAMLILLETAFPGSENEARRCQVLATFDAAQEAPTPAAEPLLVSLLGGCRVQTGRGVASEHSWRTQKTMQLFAFLALRGRPVADGLLTGTFWGESDEEHARCSLRTALHQIRQTLAPLQVGQEIVVRSRKLRTVALETPCVLDAQLFEEGVAQGAELLSLGRPAEALSSLQRALSLYRGELLEGCHEEWVQAPRAHYAELQVQALHLMARCQLSLRDAGGAERAARRALALDGWREALHEDLIEALMAQDRRGEAVRHYRQAVAEFSTELGMVPGSLHAIYDAHLALAPQLALARAS